MFVFVYMYVYVCDGGELYKSMKEQNRTAAVMSAVL